MEQIREANQILRQNPLIINELASMYRVPILCCVLR